MTTTLDLSLGTVNTETVQYSRTGTQLTVTPETTTKTLGGIVTDVSISPYMRSQYIDFSCSNLKPNDYYYTFFDEINLDSYVRTCDILFYTYDDTSSPYFGNDFIYNEKVVGQISGASGYVACTSPGEVHIKNVQGTFNEGETIIGDTSKATIKIGYNYITSGTIVGFYDNKIVLSNGSSSDTLNPHAVFGSYSDVMNSGISNFIKIVNSTQHLEVKTITNYDATTKTITLDSAFTNPLSSNLIYSIGPLTSTSNGKCVGSVYIPPNVFKTGERILRISTDKQNSNEATSYAQQKYVTQGISVEKTDFAISTRNLVLGSENVTESMPSFSYVAGITPPPVTQTATGTSPSPVTTSSPVTTTTSGVVYFTSSSLSISPGNSITPISSVKRTMGDATVSNSSTLVSNEVTGLDGYAYSVELAFKLNPISTISIPSNKPSSGYPSNINYNDASTNSVLQNLQIIGTIWKAKSGNRYAVKTFDFPAQILDVYGTTYLTSGSATKLGTIYDSNNINYNSLYGGGHTNFDLTRQSYNLYTHYYSSSYGTAHSYNLIDAYTNYKCLLLCWKYNPESSKYLFTTGYYVNPISFAIYEGTGYSQTTTTFANGNINTVPSAAQLYCPTGTKISNDTKMYAI